jgi:uncharacterized protein YbjQ (UPF0145 family)
MAKPRWQRLERELEGIPVLTSDTVPGFEITDYKGYVWGTSVQAKFIGHDILAAVKILLGGEVWQYTRMINQAKQYVIHRLVENAKALGADAVVGVRMGSAQIVPGTVEIFAYGTAVGLKKKR